VFMWCGRCIAVERWKCRRRGTWYTINQLLFYFISQCHSTELPKVGLNITFVWPFKVIIVTFQGHRCDLDMSLM